MTESKTTKENVRKFNGTYREGGDSYSVTAAVRWDDRCGNGHNRFSITGSVYNLTHPRRDREPESCGCVHGEIARAIPELLPYIKWHLFDPFGPMYYIANTVYLAGDRDCWGLRKGGKRQLRNGKTGQLCWILETDPDLPKYVDADVAPDKTVVLKYVPWYREGEGKERELDAARSTAVWPEATDAELMQEPEELTKMLEARLSGLVEAFKKDVESLGFEW